MSFPPDQELIDAFAQAGPYAVHFMLTRLLREGDEKEFVDARRRDQIDALFHRPQ